MKHKNQKGIIRRKARRSYRSANITPTVVRKQVDFLAEVSFAMKFKRGFFNKLTNKEKKNLYTLGASLYVVGFEAAGGVVK